MEGIIILFALLLIGGVITAYVFFLITLMKLLRKCSPNNRTMEGEMVWLNFIPLFGFGWFIYTVIQVRNSLQAEFKSRNIKVDDPQVGFGVGLAAGICNCCSIIPVLGILSGIAALILIVIYWMKMHEYLQLLDTDSKAILTSKQN
tara:strand:- start:258 stop:695 length:438 start_codon:yes stop_codon:yes gene_type:complete